MIELVKEIPVSFTPNWTDEWLVWLTAGSILASGILGYLAFSNGKKAVSIAEQSEKTQRQLFEKQLQAEYDSRMDAAVADLIRKVRHYYGPLSDWYRDAEEVEIYNKTDMYGELDYPDDPPLTEIEAQLEIALLFSNFDDRSVLATSDRILRALEDSYPRPRWQVLEDTIGVLRQWRSGEVLPSDAIIALYGLLGRATKAKRV